jgi:hypothetical protein
LMQYDGPASTKAPNQWIDGFFGPALLTEFFPSLPAVASLIPKVDTTISEFIQTFYIDGANIEQSFNYANQTSLWLRRLAGLSGRPWVNTIKTVFTNYWRQQAALSNPQGGNPQVGNTEWNTGSLTQGYSFSQTSIAFPYSGYYVQRLAWDSSTPYLFFFSRRLTRGHSMAGSNSIQMGAYGRKLIVAGGGSYYSDVSAYPNSIPYQEEGSTWKTSTIVVDGNCQKNGSTTGLLVDASGNPDIYHASTTPIQSRWATSTTFDFLEGTYDADYGYDPYTKSTKTASGVIHKRMVTFVRDIQAWVVVDFMLPNNTNNHTYTQIWKLAPPTPQAQGSATQTEGFYPSQITLPSSGSGVNKIYTNDSTSGAVNLSIYQTSPQTLNYAKYYGSDTNSKYGFYTAAPHFSPDIHVNWSGSGNQVVISVLLPFQDSASDGVTTSVNTTSSNTAGLDITIKGKQLSIHAAANGTSSNLASLTIIESDSAGANPRTITIGDSTNLASSYFTTAGITKPITAPTGFHWTTDSAGALTANYTA